MGDASAPRATRSSETTLQVNIGCARCLLHATPKKQNAAASSTHGQLHPIIATADLNVGAGVGCDAIIGGKPPSTGFTDSERVRLFEPVFPNRSISSLSCFERPQRPRAVFVGALAAGRTSTPQRRGVQRDWSNRMWSNRIAE